MKILLNAYPRSGSTTFTDSLRKSVRDTRPGNYTELAEGNDWIIYKHEPFIHFGFYGDDVVQATILRDPIDAIASNVERWFKGFTGNVIQGVRIVNNGLNIIDSIDVLDDQKLGFINHQIEIYQSYLKCLEKNIDNVTCFTYSQTRNQTDICIKNLLILSGVDISKIREYNIDNTISNREDKHPIYYQVREVLMAQEGLYDVYIRVLEQAINKQKSLPIQFNSVV